MRIYISTPINARTEKSFEDKKRAAKHRVNLLKEIIKDDSRFNDYSTVVSTFDVSTIGTQTTEQQAMGMCITAVLESDAIYLDHGWNCSRGCRLEYYAAKIYGLRIIEHDKE